MKESIATAVKIAARAILLVAAAGLAVCTASMFTGCAVLTESQLKAVNALSTKSDTVATAPEHIFECLATVREERGLYYAASLTSAQAKFLEMNGLAEESISDAKAVEKASLYADVLDSYLRALRQLSAETRYSQYGTRIRGLGSKSDSLISALNKTEWIKDDNGDAYSIPEGYAKMAGKVTGYLTEEYMRRRQAKFVKEYVTSGDTLVGKCCDALSDLLKKKDCRELYENEAEGLKENYLAYLQRMERLGGAPGIEEDRNYLVLSRKLDNAKLTSEKCSGALKSLKRAHHKLVGTLAERKDLKEHIAEFEELNTYAEQVAELVKKLEKTDKD